MQRRFFWLCVPAVVACLAMTGCLETVVDVINDDVDIPAADGGATITVTAPSSATTVALGTPVQIRWTVSSLPNAATVDLAYQISGQTSTTPIVSNLAVNAQGSFSFDTSDLTIGFKYVVVATLKSNGTVVSTAKSAGAITIAKPVISVSAPSADLTLLPSESMAVKWTGDYPPIGGRLEVFLDLDKSYQNGNELAVSSDVVTEQSTSQSGTVTVAAATLLNTPSFQRGRFYFVGVRLMKGTSLVNASYAPAAVRAYDGDRFAIVEPAEDINILVGNKVSVVWNPSGVPTPLTVTVLFEDVDSGDRSTAVANVAVATGRALASTSALQPLHTYNIVVQLKDGASLVTELVADGQVYATGWGSTIEVGLEEETDTEFVGLGGSIDISWDVTWGVGPSQENSVVKLYLDEDGEWSTTDDQIEITPTGGVDPELGQYTFSPTVANDADLAGKDYYVFAELVMAGPHAVSRTENLLHVGEGCVEITAPTTDVEKSLGDTVTAKWALLGEPCTRLPDADIELKLYVDTVSTYNPATAKLVSSSTTKLRPCLTTEWTFTIDESFRMGVNYYVIARLFVDGVEAHRVASGGRVLVPAVTFSVDEPAEDVTTGLSAIDVEWTLSGIPTASRFIRVKAVAQTGTLAGRELTISGDEPAANSSTTANASKLPPGTYGVRCYLMTTDAGGNELILMQANAAGRLVLSGGYNGTYDLLDMQNGKTAGFSPVDGVIFNGAYRGDGAGYAVAGLGDITGDGYGDFMIFARYGNLMTAGPTGSGYLIHGGFPTTGQPSDNESMIFEFPLLNLPGTLNPKLQVSGTVVAFPIDNVTTDLGGGNITGQFTVTDLPDISGDGRGDLMIGCPTAAPMHVTYSNYTDKTLTFTDPYGITRTIAPMGQANDEFDEPMHVMFPTIDLVVRADKWTYDAVTNVITGVTESTETLRYVFPLDDYEAGTQLEVEFHTQHVSFCTTPGDASTRVAFDRIVTGYSATTDFVINAPDADPPLTQGDVDNNHTDINARLTKSAERRGSVYVVTSDMLNDQNLLNAWRIFDLNEVLGTPDKNPAYDSPANSMMLTMEQVGTDFGGNISVIPDALGTDRPQLLIGAKNAIAFDWAATNPIATARAAGGTVTITDSYRRPTAIRTPAERGAMEWIDGTMITLSVDAADSLEMLFIEGPEANANLAPSVSLGYFNSANSRGTGSFVGGDFDGDGMAEIVVSAPGEDAATLSNSGAIYIIQGSPIKGFRYPVMDLADFNVIPTQTNPPGLEVPIMGWKIEGSAVDMALGSQLAPCGDFNGDGFSDFVIVEPNADNSGGDAGAGKITIIFGGEYLLNTYSIADAGGAEADAIQALVFEGDAAGDHFGSEIRGVYDVNQDGLNDLLVSAPDADATGKAGCGKVYLIYGRSTAVKTNPATQNRFVDYNDDDTPDTNAINAEMLGVTLPGAIFVGAAAGDRLSSVSSAGDANGDGIGDFLIGAPGANGKGSLVGARKAYLVFGRRYIID